jgi:predicted membrane chloride channel (bestrophin family)
VYKSFFPCLLTSVIFVILFQFLHFDESNELFLHPYPMGALISALTFLLTFRANFSYNRYWESVTAVYQMHSKWLDVGTTVGTILYTALCSFADFLIVYVSDITHAFCSTVRIQPHSIYNHLSMISGNHPHLVRIHKLIASNVLVNGCTSLLWKN